MSRIASYHDLSIYSTYNKSQSSSTKKTTEKTEPMDTPNNSVKVSISSTGLDTLKTQKINSNSQEQTASKESQNSNQLTTNSYKSKQATQQYQNNAKFYNENA